MNNLPFSTLPQVILIHDLCGYGNCSLKIALPTLSVAGIHSIPLASALLSSHTGYEGAKILDTTHLWQDYFKHWESLPLALSGSYTGFLGSKQQIHLIQEFMEKFPKLDHIVDPVMGDHGMPYRTYSPDMCQQLSFLLPHAHILMPNLTEAALLTQTEYKGQSISLEEGKDLCRRLQDKGAKNIILKGIRQDDMLHNLILKEDTTFQIISTTYLPGQLFGSGDLFASIVTATHFWNIPLEKGVSLATDIVSQSISFSLSQPNWQRYGVTFEPFLWQVSPNALSKIKNS